MQVGVISRNGKKFEKSEEAYWFDCKFELRRQQSRRQKACSVSRSEAKCGVVIVQDREKKKGRKEKKVHCKQ